MAAKAYQLIDCKYLLMLARKSVVFDKKNIRFCPSIIVSSL